MTSIWDDETVTPAAADHGTARRRPFLEAFGLAAAATSIPLLVVLGRHPEFFVVHDVGVAGFVLFALVVGVALPAALAGLVLAAGRLHRLVRAVGVTVLAALAVGTLLANVTSGALLFVLSLAAGLLVARSEPRSPGLRGLFMALALLAVVVLAWFVALSAAGGLVRTGELEAAVQEPPTVDQPVVLVTLDELPLSALLDTDLTIDEERFPAFARLAEQSDWYPRASAASAAAVTSVPGIWSGTHPDDAAPVASEHPSSVLAQLGQTHEGDVAESITALCPAEVCDGTPPDGGGPALGADARPGLLGHTIEVFLQTAGLDQLLGGMRPYERAWTGTVEAGALAVDTDPDDDGQPVAVDERSYEEKVDAALEWADDCTVRDGRPPLCVAHLSVPRGPYSANPDGSVYATTPLGLDGTSVSPEGAVVWDADETLRAQGYQRLLLQVGAVDHLLGQIMERLEENGVWQDAAVAVVAAHGVSFEEGFLWSSSVEVTSVPLFIKAPGQTEGEVRSEAALTVDVAPTLLGLLGVEAPDDVVGLDLEHDAVPEQRVGGFARGVESDTPDQSEASLQNLVDERSRWLDLDGGWSAVAAAGPQPELLGESLSARTLGFPGGSYGVRPVDGSAGNVRPIVVRATVDLEALVAVVGDRIVATTPGVAPGSPTLRTVVALPEDLSADDDLLLYGVAADGTLHELVEERTDAG